MDNFEKKQRYVLDNVLLNFENHKINIFNFLKKLRLFKKILMKILESINELTILGFNNVKINKEMAQVLVVMQKQIDELREKIDGMEKKL